MDEPKIRSIQPKKLVGLKIRTSLSEDRTFDLWTRFMPQVKNIRNQKKSGYYSVQLFDENLEFYRFTPQTYFEKWAAVEVEDFTDIPEELEIYTLPGGKYAVFIHNGPAKNFPETSQYIFEKWIPNSSFNLDKRPHFEVMGYDYRHDDPKAEEEIWVPVQKIQLLHE